MQPTFPPPEALRRPPIRLADIAVVLGALTVLAILAKVGSGMFVGFTPPKLVPHISLDPHNLPGYAARSTLRMFIALFWSLLFTFAYGYAAARSKRAERVLVPMLDVLQSVPVLGFLSITVTGFIALFPGSLLGLEAASIFAIFTGQAWNMTFSFYQSLRTVPRDLDEMATLYGLSRWEKFSRLEVPSAMIGLVWNGMMSFGGGWFFLAASEAISVLNHNYTLPGLGSYVAAAVAQQNLKALAWAVLTMVLLIVAIDQFFWRPLVTLADRYKLELSAGEVRRFWVNDLWRSAHLPYYASRLFSPAGRAIDRVFCRVTEVRAAAPRVAASPTSDRIYHAVLIFITAGLVVAAIRFVLEGAGIAE